MKMSTLPQPEWLGKLRPPALRPSPTEAATSRGALQPRSYSPCPTGYLQERGELYDRVVTRQAHRRSHARGAVAKLMTPDNHRPSHAYNLPPLCSRPKPTAAQSRSMHVCPPFRYDVRDWWGEWGLPPLNGIAWLPCFERMARRTASQATMLSPGCGWRRSRI
jgi:hypothetical protein